MLAHFVVRSMQLVQQMSMPIYTALDLWLSFHIQVVTLHWFITHTHTNATALRIEDVLKYTESISGSSCFIFMPNCGFSEANFKNDSFSFCWKEFGKKIGWFSEQPGEKKASSLSWCTQSYHLGWWIKYWKGNYGRIRAEKSWALAVL